MLKNNYKKHFLHMYKINRFIASSIPEDRSQTYIHSQIQSVQNNEHEANLCY